MDLFAAQPKQIGHGNAQFLADLLEPGMTITELRNRTRQGRYPNLWKGCAQWIKMGNVT